MTKKYIAIVAAVVAVIAACTAMIVLGGHKEDTQVQAGKKDELQIISCQDVVQVNVGEMLNLDQLNLVYLCPDEVSYSFTEKQYDVPGVYNEELVLTDMVTGKTDSAMIRVLVKGAAAGQPVEGDALAEASGQEGSQQSVDTLTPEQQMQTEEGAALPQEGQVVVDAVMYATKSVFVRNAPGENGERIGSLSEGQQIHVIGQDAATGWYLIEYGNEQAYVSNEFVSGTQP